MSIVRVAVIETGSQYLVRPAVAFLLRNVEPPASDKLRVMNRTSHDLDVRASGPWPFTASSPQTVSAGGQITLDLASKVALGSYFYKVIVNVGSTLLEALGNSDPVIIIDDP